MNKFNQIRVVVLAIIENNGKILVSKGSDPDSGTEFYRPLGGGVEFGEMLSDAVKRELKEEIDVDIIPEKSLIADENIFVYGGKKAHECVFLYECEFADTVNYSKDSFIGVESNGMPFDAVWININDVKSGKIICYPEFILNVI